MSTAASEAAVRRLLEAEAASDGRKMMVGLAPEIEVTDTFGGAEETSTVTRLDELDALADE